jgi:hypothetical protein
LGTGEDFVYILWIGNWKAVCQHGRDLQGARLDGCGPKDRGPNWAVCLLHQRHNSDVALLQSQSRRTSRLMRWKVLLGENKSTSDLLPLLWRPASLIASAAAQRQARVNQPNPSPAKQWCRNDNLTICARARTVGGNRRNV